MNLRTSGENEAMDAEASGRIRDKFGLICRGAQLRSCSVGLLGVFLGWWSLPAGISLYFTSLYFTSSLLLRSLLFSFLIERDSSAVLF